VLGDDADENHDGELPEVGLILLSSSFPRRRRSGSRDGGKVAARIFLGDFF